MSRIGKQPVVIPSPVKVAVKDGEISVSGPKGSLVLKIRPEIKAVVKDNQVLVSRKDDSKFSRSLHGLIRSLIANMVEGVTNGFSKTLKLIGTGYRVKAEGEKIVLSVGFSHQPEVIPPPGIKFEVEGSDIIKISGADKILVGQWAAKIRALRPPEPYKGKGIRYLNEEVRHKAGKAGKAGVAAAGGAK